MFDTTNRLCQVQIFLSKMNQSDTLVLLDSGTQQSVNGVELYIASSRIRMDGGELGSYILPSCSARESVSETPGCWCGGEPLTGHTRPTLPAHRSLIQPDTHTH